MGVAAADPEGQLCRQRYTGIYPGFIDLDVRGSMYNYSWGSAERVGKATYYINLAADAKASHSRARGTTGSRCRRMRP
jgi:hypothetical protein